MLDSAQVEIDSKDNTKQFTGKIKDAETGLNYFEARYMNSNTGRFTQVDPQVMLAVANILSDPQSLNSYAYARNNPVAIID